MKAYSKGASIGSQVETYIRSLRNPAKKQYANDYAIWQMGGRVDANPSGLSYMAGQAVRFRILAIINSDN